MIPPKTCLETMQCLIAVLVSAVLLSGEAFAQDTPAPDASAVAPVAASPETPPVVDASLTPKTQAPPTNDSPPVTPPASKSADTEEEDVIVPWDYDPYRILVWVISDDPSVDTSKIQAPLHAYFDRNYLSTWRVKIQDAPTSVASIAIRDLDNLTFEMLTAADPVIAVKRNHKDAVRIRTPPNIDQYVKAVHATPSYAEMVKSRGKAMGDESLQGAARKFSDFDGDALKLKEKWTEDETEALLVPRGIAATLDEPEAKLIKLPVTNLVSTAVDDYDKIFLAVVRRDQVPYRVSVVEFNTLMRYFGATVDEMFVSTEDIPGAMGLAISTAFSPEVRVDEAGLKVCTGLTRAGGLIVDKDSELLVKPGDLLLPMLRKNDRNGRPIMIGALDWSYLLAVDPNESKSKKPTKKDGADSKPEEKEEFEQSYVKMELYSGRIGGLAGRKNSRTFRRALLIHPKGGETMVRLHSKGKPNEPLIGYELYEKELYSKKMTFVGRTDWNGRLNIEVSEDPLRLLYVKNGGAVLARLPIVPGFTPYEVADLTGDDMRLQAEAYVNGVSNAIIDLVALRKLLGTRIRNRLKKGQMKEAEELLLALREQPSKEILSTDMDRKLGYFLNAIGPRAANARRKVENMFSTTREMLDKQISQREIQAIEEDFIRAKSNGGRLPEDPDDGKEEYDPSVNEVSAEEPAK